MSDCTIVQCTPETRERKHFVVCQIDKRNLSPKGTLRLMVELPN